MTLRGVATARGGSTATVSTVVNPAACAWALGTTHARVQATVDALGYHPNQLARTLWWRRRAGGDAAHPTAPAVSRGPDVAAACGVSNTTVFAAVGALAR